MSNMIPRDVKLSEDIDLFAKPTATQPAPKLRQIEQPYVLMEIEKRVLGDQA